MANNVEHFARQDFDVIVTTGQEMESVTKEMAMNYPRIHFLGVNQNGFEEILNASNLGFSAEKIGYAAGALAAKTTNSNVVGIVISNESSQQTSDLRIGYESGVTAFPQDIKVIVLAHPEANHESAHDVAWGQQAATELLSAGADVIFAEDNATGRSALVATAQAGETYCIGIGANLWSDVSEAHPCLVAGIKRHITEGTFETIARVAVSQGDHHSHDAEHFNGRIEYVFYSLFDEVVADYDKELLQDIVKVIGNNSIDTDDVEIHKPDSEHNSERHHVHVDGDH